MLTQKQLAAIRSFNTDERLLEDVMLHLKQRYFDEWKNSAKDHKIQREELYLKTLVLDDVAKVIRQATNEKYFD